MINDDGNEHDRRASARARVLGRLQTGPALNTELNQVCYRYGARILELRGRGFNITTTRLGAGVFRYELAAPVMPEPAPAAPDIMPTLF